jgi:hypothetical protein
MECRRIGVGNGFRRPRPPNRACGSPAHGSPVGGFLIGIGSLTHRCNRVNHQMCREKALAICLLNAVSSAANMRSLHTEASTHDLFRPCVSAPCVAPSGTAGAWLSLCFLVKLTLPPSYLPSLGAVLLPAPLAALPLRYYGDSDSCATHPQRRSPRLPLHTFLSFRLQPRGLPEHRYHHASVSSEFRTSP